MIKKLKKFYNRHFVKKTNPEMSFGCVTINKSPSGRTGHDGVFHKGFVDGNGEMRFETWGVKEDFMKTEFHSTAKITKTYNLISSGLFKATQVFPMEENFNADIFKETNTMTGLYDYYFYDKAASFEDAYKPSQKRYINKKILEATGDVVVI